MRKWKCTLIPNQEHIKKFNMTYEIDKNNNGDCSDVATTLALGDVKQTLTNYFKVDVEEIK